MILNALLSHQSNGNPGYKNLINVINRSHETVKNKSKHRKRAALLFKALLHAQIFSIVKNIKTGSRIVANESLQQDFSLHNTLSLYLLEALSVLDKNQPEYAIDVLSLTEAIVENPHAILNRQLEKKKEEAMASMKAEGLEYDARIEALEKIEYDKPLKDFIYETFNVFEKKHPWIEQENIHPKSIARDMFLKGATFNEYIGEFGLARMEGLLLRYVSQVYKALVQSVPDSYKTDDVLDIIAYLRTVLSRVDTSLIDEWESLFEAPKKSLETSERPTLSLYDPRINPKAFAARIRSELYQLVRQLAQKNYEEAGLLLLNSLENAWTKERFEMALTDFYAEYEKIEGGPMARSPKLTTIKKISDTKYAITHTLLDEKDENAWHLFLSVDLDAHKEESMPLLWLETISS